MDRSVSVLQRLITNRIQPGVALFYLLAFCILAVSVTFFALSIGKPYMGICLSMKDGVWAVVIEDINGPASQAGIVEGDRPLEINGQPAEVFLEKYENAGIVMGRLIKEITSADSHGQLKLVSLKDSPISWQYATTQIIWVIVCLIFWITGFYVLRKRPKILAAKLLCLCGLTFGLVLSANMAAEREIPTAIWFEISATAISPCLLLHFFLVLPNKRTGLYNSPIIYFIYSPALIILILYPLVGYADGQSLPLFRSIRMFIYGVVFLAILIVILISYFRAVSHKTRQQMKIVLIGCTAAFLPLVSLSTFPEAAGRQPIIPSGYGVIFVSFIPLSLGYAVTTQKLMDIDIIIRRGVIYGLITFFIAIIFSVAIFATVHFQELFGLYERIYIALGLGIIATILFGPLKKWIENIIDRLFYKDRYDYKQVIVILSTSLSSGKDFNNLSRIIVGTLVQSLDLEGCCIFIKTQSNDYQVVAAKGIFVNAGKQRRLSKFISQRHEELEFPNTASGIDRDLEFIIPLIAAEKEVGILCISQKVSRQKFSSTDIYLLQGVASTASITLRSAELIKDVSLRDNFVSIASHELRTPMSTIMGYTELLLKQETSDTTRKQALENIINSGKSINVMLDDLLNVTRIQSGKISPLVEEIDLSKVINEQLAFIQDTTSKHKFIINIEHNIPNAFVDRDKFSQVMSNLLSNAVKYSPDGGRITISAYHDILNDQIVVSVTDEGIGISSEDENLLFTTFHRIQRPETQGIRGSGLGLYIAKEWMEAMGGKIWLESELNKGSTFFVSIPIKATAE